MSVYVRAGRDRLPLCRGCRMLALRDATLAGVVLEPDGASWRPCARCAARLGERWRAWYRRLLGLTLPEIAAALLAASAALLSCAPPEREPDRSDPFPPYQVRGGPVLQAWILDTAAGPAVVLRETHPFGCPENPVPHGAHGDTGPAVMVHWTEQPDQGARPARPDILPAAD